MRFKEIFGLCDDGFRAPNYRQTIVFFSIFPSIPVQQAPLRQQAADVLESDGATGGKKMQLYAGARENVNGNGSWNIWVPSNLMPELLFAFQQFFHSAKF